MLKAIQELLKSTFLEAANIIELAIPRTTDTAIAIAVTSENKLQAWQLLRNHLDQTQRYPVLANCWTSNNSSTWEEYMIAADFFSRFEFDLEYPKKLSPEEIIAKAELYKQDDSSDFYPNNFEQAILYELEKTRAEYGIAPSLSEVKESTAIRTYEDIERYLFHWEQRQKLEPKLYLDYQDWFNPGDDSLILLPNPHSWNALAYLSWFGGSKNAIPLIKQWHRDYGAELVCHFGTMLQFFVERPPTDPETAFDLACQQVALAECTTLLPGVSIRNHASALLKLDRWFLHERP